MKRIFLLLAIALLVAGCGQETEKTEQSTTEEQAGEETLPSEEQVTVEITEETPAEETTEAEETAEEAEEESAEEPAQSFEVIAVEGCTDSDNGKDYSTAGSLTDIDGIEDTDTCSTNENYPGRMYEVYCKETGRHGRETYDCPSGKCQAGACVE